MEDDVISAFLDELATKQYGVEEVTDKDVQAVTSSFTKQGGEVDALLSGDMDTVSLLKDTIVDHYVNSGDLETGDDEKEAGLFGLFFASKNSSLHRFVSSIVSTELKNA